MSVPGELERARQLAFADDQAGAQALLLSLMPQIVELDRDDLALEVFAQLGEVYLVRSAYDGVAECVRRIRDCVSIYVQIAADPYSKDAAQVTLPAAVVDEMVIRYTRRADHLEIGLAAAAGDHEAAAAGLADLIGQSNSGSAPNLAGEAVELIMRARISCAVALADDDDHVSAEILWDAVLAVLDESERTAESDHLWVLVGIGYGRFCVETGRLHEAEPYLRRAGARAERRGWGLASARVLLERSAAAWSRSDVVDTERLLTLAYPVIAQHAIAHDVSRCWLYFGLTRMAAGALEAADECFQHAQRHWEELGRPLHVSRILLQRSWIDIFRGRYAQARDAIEQARAMLDSSPRSTWLQYARLDDLLGSAWRAEALADMGFDGSGEPDEGWRELEARLAGSRGVVDAAPGTEGYDRAMPKFERAADLKIPAALAVDSVRHTLADATARLRWTAAVSAPVLAGAFAVAWEWENVALVAELIEYQSARGTFTTEPDPSMVADWEVTATAATPAMADISEAAFAGGTAVATPSALTRLGPLPSLQMDPAGPAVLARYRALAQGRYGRVVTSSDPLWATWP
ncbi:hypothetical protein [Gordonia rubripertincta]|uniref:Tetratricopeptide repeat protein n=1 Tax=Gordonia rubripertincta TaxID=36822 RepID=A0ABT4N293_GORRU|nr:hypothetical protein [Gordonia rubripertincta]MCZ4553395.1 hypothetical protein [Gordonia rubripertincta]